MYVLQVIDKVTDVAAVCLGDFVGCGQTQILCLHSGFPWDSAARWQLTDRGLWLFDREARGAEHQSDHQPAVLALQKRLQVLTRSYPIYCSIDYSLIKDALYLFGY